MTPNTRLVELRRRAGLSQVALSRRAGMSQRLVSNIECGARKGTIGTLAKLAKVLGVSVSYLIGENVEEWREGGGREEILNDPFAPVGLQQLARNQALCEPLAISIEEWAVLRFIEPPYLLPEAAYIAILHVIRACRPVV